LAKSHPKLLFVSQRVAKRFLGGSAPPPGEPVTMEAAPPSGGGLPQGAVVPGAFLDYNLHKSSQQ
jgi:hypothetical protein